MPSRPLVWILSLSALYDGAAFVLLLAIPAWLLRLFDHPPVTDPFLFRLAGLPLLLLPLVYLAAARRGGDCPALVRLAVVLRVVGAAGIAMLVLVHRPSGAGAYWFFVIGDLVWAALYLAGMRRRAPAVRPTP